MIAGKILPCFYLLKLEGAAIETVFPGEFNIEEVIIKSGDFATDMDTISASKFAMAFVTNNPNVDIKNIRENVKFNPDFFPSLPKIELSEEQKQQQEELDEIADEKSEGGKKYIALTRIFDDMGDFVHTKWTIEGDNFASTLKIGVNIDSYIKEKTEEYLSTEKSLISVKQEQFLYH